MPLSVLHYTVTGAPHDPSALIDGPAWDMAHVIGGAFAVGDYGLAASALTDTTNAGNISAGTLAAARLPALTGDITTGAGSAATSLAPTIAGAKTWTGTQTITATSALLRINSTSSPADAEAQWFSSGAVKWAAGMSVGDATENWSLYSYNAGATALRVSRTDVSVSLFSTTASTSTTTGALTVVGGFGVQGAANVGGAMNVAGLVNFSNATAASAYNSAAVTIAGGLGVADKLYIGTGSAGGGLNLSGPAGTNNGPFALFRYAGNTAFGFGRSAAVLGGTADDFVITASERSDGTASIDISRGANSGSASGGVVSFMNGVGGNAVAGGSLSARILFGGGNLGLYWGSGAPTVSASQGSLYIRTDGSSTSTRLYVNTSGGSTWTSFTSAT